jgi:hypothetical protein
MPARRLEAQRRRGGLDVLADRLRHLGCPRASPLTLPSLFHEKASHCQPPWWAWPRSALVGPRHVGPDLHGPSSCARAVRRCPASIRTRGGQFWSGARWVPQLDAAISRTSSDVPAPEGRAVTRMRRRRSGGHRARPRLCWSWVIRLTTIVRSTPRPPARAGALGRAGHRAWR